jgi:DNA replication protein DnaC
LQSVAISSGTGKSHLLIALGTAAAMAGQRVRYTLAAKLANELVRAESSLRLHQLTTATRSETILDGHGAAAARP